MNVTPVTLKWYRQKLRPEWAKALTSKEHGISIDAVINSQAGIKQSEHDKDFTKISFIHICKIVRKRRVLAEYLEDLIASAAVDERGRKYRIYAKRWLKKLNRQKRREQHDNNKT